MEKICNKCGISKELEMFPKDKGIKCGRISICKECCYKSIGERRKNNRESYDLKAEKYRELHKEKVCNKCWINKGLDMFANARGNKDGKHNTCRKCDGERRNKQYYENREHHIAKVKEYYNKNKDYYKVQSKIYREDNKERLNEYDKFIYKNTTRGAVQVFQKRVNRCIEPGKHKEIGKKCRIKYIDKYRAIGREWYKNNKELIKQYQVQYRKTHRDKCNEWYVEYKTRKTNQIPP